MKKFAVILTLCLVAASASAQAQESQNVWEMAESEKYGTKAGGMLGRGVVNVATCFVDLLVQTVDKTKEGPAFIGTMSGLGSGLGCSALRVTSGATDVLTFWVPDFNGFPISRNYSNCLEGTSFDSSAAMTPVAPAPDYSAEQARLAKAAKDAQDAIAAERAKALAEIEAEKARLAAEKARLEAEKKAAEANKNKYIK